MAKMADSARVQGYGFAQDNRYYRVAVTSWLRCWQHRHSALGTQRRWSNHKQSQVTACALRAVLHVYFPRSICA